MTNPDALRYPIGKFTPPARVTMEQVQLWITEIERLPGRLRTIADNLSEEQLQTPYRPGGWTARQVIHHIADSHINAYVRFKLAVTEDNPSLSPI